MGGIKSKANKTNFNCQMLFALQGIENGTGSKVFYNSLCWLALSRPPVENVRPRKCMSDQEKACPVHILFMEIAAF